MGIKYTADENFFKKWSPQMAYFLGLIYADGSLEDSPRIRGKYLKFSSTNKELINNLKKALKSKHSIVKTPAFGKRKEKYLLRIGSHIIFDDLSKIGLHPKKSLTILFPNVSASYLSHFVRGYFDGDGCISISHAKGKTRSKIFKKIVIVFTSGSKNFLNELSLRLHGEIANLKNMKVYESKRSFQLRYSTKDSVEIFKFMYKESQNLFLKRKFNKFKTFFDLRNNWLDKEISFILKKN